MIKRYVVALLVVFWVGASHAAIESLEFKSPEQEETYKVLIDELRCLVCQNQNLADSDAELAQDLRKQVYKMITEKGADKDEIVDYMVARYGDFVLYRPPLKGNTLLLWIGPMLLMAVGIFVALRFIRSTSKSTVSTEVDLSEVKKILDSEEKS